MEIMERRLAKEEKAKHLNRNPDGTYNLSRREHECLVWAAKGKSYVEIQDILNISFASVKTYLDVARLKLNAVNLTHAVALAYERGIFSHDTVAYVPFHKVPQKLELLP